MSLVCRYGILKTLVSDNGTRFISNTLPFFQPFGFEHVIILRSKNCSYNSASSGQAEKYVDAIKRALRKMCQEVSSKDHSYNGLLSLVFGLELDDDYYSSSRHLAVTCTTVLSNCTTEAVTVTRCVPRLLFRYRLNFHYCSVPVLRIPPY